MKSELKALLTDDWEDWAMWGGKYVLYFWASWHGPSRALASQIEPYLDGVRISGLQVDSPAGSEMAMKFGVTALPTLVFLDGVCKDMVLSGVGGRKALAAALAEWKFNSEVSQRGAVSGVGPCPHCGEMHRYYYHAQEPCDDCIKEWMEDSQNVEDTREAEQTPKTKK